MNAEIRYINKPLNGIKYPYVYSRDVFKDMCGILQTPEDFPLAGFCFIVEMVKEAEQRGQGSRGYVKSAIEYVKRCEELGLNVTSLHSIIHLNTDSDFMDTTFSYFHEMGHAVLDQVENIDAKYYESYSNAEAAGVADNKRGDLGFTEHQAKNYTENPIEVQADAYACLMTGGTWKTLWFKRFYLKGCGISGLYGYRDWWASLGLNEEQLKEKEENYKKLFEKETAKVKQWANAGCLARLKTYVKSL